MFSKCCMFLSGVQENVDDVGEGAEEAGCELGPGRHFGVSARVSRAVDALRVLAKDTVGISYLSAPPRHFGSDPKRCVNGGRAAKITHTDGHAAQRPALIPLTHECQCRRALPSNYQLVIYTRQCSHCRQLLDRRISLSLSTPIVCGPHFLDQSIIISCNQLLNIQYVEIFSVRLPQKKGV
jgi:hypothetical protein